jgi:hypothetical protein
VNENSAWRRSADYEAETVAERVHDSDSGSSDRTNTMATWARYLWLSCRAATDGTIS